MTKLFVSNKDESERIFKSDNFEAFSRIHPVVPLVLYVPVVGYMLYRSIGFGSLDGSSIVALVAAGAITWTLTEYLMHRFLFHFSARASWLRRLTWIMHGVHHDYPNDSRRLVMPPIVSIPLAILFFMLFLSLIGNQLVYPFFAGFIAGYLSYDMVHYAIHHFEMRSRFGRWLRKHHMLHHYRENGRAFGVSSPLWDHVFRTMP